MFKQTEAKYKSVLMGFGTGSIHDFGCYLVSLCNGLLTKGYTFTPESLNDLLKKNNAWIGEFRNYIDVDRLDDILPDIFKKYEKIEPWSDMAQLAGYLTAGCVVVAKVDARGIGGSGTHFVLVTKIDGANVMIFDPWYGDEIKVASRYSKYGNILSLRVFYVVAKGGTVMPDNWIVENSDKWRGLIFALKIETDPEHTPTDKVTSIIAGYKSRATDMETQAKWWETEAKNREEQVSRKKEELLTATQTIKDLSTKLNEAIANAGGVAEVWQKQLDGKQTLIDAQGKTIGELNHAVSELELKLKNANQNQPNVDNFVQKCITWVMKFIMNMKGVK